MSETNFAIRTVRKGRVKVHHEWYQVDETHLPYDGRLDNQRFAFGLYRGFDVICLWGTEAYYNDMETSPEGPEIVDGSLPWLWWRKVKVDVSFVLQ